jgi:hypothetical protein
MQFCLNQTVGAPKVWVCIRCGTQTRAEALPAFMNLNARQIKFKFVKEQIVMNLSEKKKNCSPADRPKNEKIRIHRDSDKERCRN